MTTGRINQVCASPPATHLNPQGASMCREAVVNKVWFSHHTQVTTRDGYCTLSELAPWHPKTRQNERKESFQRALTTRFRFALTRCKQSTALLKGSSSCLALQFSSSINTHKGPCLKEANFAPSTERSRDPLTTMTQCVLVGKEPNSQSTVIHIKSLSLPFPFRVSVSLFPFGSGGWRSSILPPTHVYSQASCRLLFSNSHVFCSFNENYLAPLGSVECQKVLRTFSDAFAQ